MRRLLFLCALLLMPAARLSAQGDDFGVWTYLGLNKKISKVVSFYTEAEYRTRGNASTVDCWSLYGEFSARICPYLKAGGGYTFIEYNHPSLSWEGRHRLNVFAIGSYSAGAWSFAVRERYEEVHRMIKSKSGPRPAPKRTLRSRFECSYKITGSRFTPYATAELYTSLNTQQGVMNDKIRYTLGMSVAVCKRHAFSLYYRYIDMLNQVSGNSHILGLGFRFNL